MSLYLPPTTRILPLATSCCTVLRRAGIERRIRPYDLRHAFASRALDHDADLKCVAEVMGHANEKMIVRFYRHTSAKQRRKAVNAAPSLGLE